MFEIILAFFTGCLVAAVLAVLLLKNREAGRRGQESAEKARLEERLAARETKLSETEADLDRKEQLNDEGAAERMALKASLVQLESENKFLQERLEVERKEIEGLQEKFRRDFEAISSKLLVENSSAFNKESAENLERLLSPLKETMGEFRLALDTTRLETATNSALLKDQIGLVGSEANRLARALKGDAKILGNWGEDMLDKILELSGLQKNIHYRRQQSATDGEGDRRFLDVLVDLPEGRSLVIDSKISLRSYEQSVNCEEVSERIQFLDQHVGAIRSHFRGLGSKRYQDLHGIKSLDFVFMYIPIEGAFFAALAQEQALFEEAIANNVVLITNSTLLATLRTVSNLWRLAAQEKNAQEIADRGGKLYDKFVGFVMDLEDVKKSLKTSQFKLDEAMNKLHGGRGNLVAQAERMKSLGIKTAKSLPAALIENGIEVSDDPLAVRLLNASDAEPDSESTAAPLESPTEEPAAPPVVTESH